MLAMTEDEKARAASCVEEFARHRRTGQFQDFECVYRSHDFADTRMVLKLSGQNRDYALKIDTVSPNTGRLRKEFALLTDLHGYFQSNASTQVVTPFYLSPSETFFVTEFIDRPTAVDLIHNSTDDDQVAQVFRRAGAWLNDFHGRQPPIDYGFRPKWMTDSIRELLTNVPPEIVNQGQRMLDVMLAEGERLKGIAEIRVLAHGDFHGQNLILGQGQTFGLDFTEASEKLAVYDIVDFLKSDIFRETAARDVDRSGITRRNKDMFFRRYRHPINRDILDHCIRGRLLKDWLTLSQTDQTYSDYERDRQHRLATRLHIAFDL